MKKRNHTGSGLIGAVAAAVLACTVLTAVLLSAACSKGGMTTDKSNPFASFAEVVELNAELQAPAVMGESQKNIERLGYESTGGVEHHLMTYRCKESRDVIYTLSTYEMHYGEPDKSTEIYVTGMRILPENKTIEKDKDGKTYPVYTTSRSVFGIKLGDDIEGAREKLLAKGYEILYEEPRKEGGLPKTYEHSFRKGAVVISLGAENGGDISQMNIWIPYFDEEIGRINSMSHLPADLGITYSVMTNSAFTYAGKNSTSRRYETEDGCVAIMRGFPDLIDMGMTAEVSFTSDKYDVLGVKTGMTEDEARNILVEKGCTEENGLFVFNSVAAVQLTVENGIVTRIAATLKPSTNLSNIDTDK